MGASLSRKLTGRVPRRSVILLASAVALIVVGAVVLVLVAGTAGDAIGLWMIGVGFVLVTSWVFMQVGLSEDREVAREEQARARAAERAEHGRRRRLGFGQRRPRGPG